MILQDSSIRYEVSCRSRQQGTVHRTVPLEWVRVPSGFAKTKQHPKRGAAFSGAGNRTRFTFSPRREKIMVCPPSSRRAADGHRTSAWNGFESFRPDKNKTAPPKGCCFIWCGQQDSNLHAFAVEPKSTESTNSTMPAYLIGSPCSVQNQ